MDSPPDALALPGKKFVTMDDEQRATAFYSDAIHRVIPEGAMPISDAVWRKWAVLGRDARWDGKKVVEIPRPPVSEPLPYTRTDTIWKRCTEAEAVRLAKLVDAQAVRVQRLFAGVAIQPGDEAFAQLVGAIHATFGTDRATELLAPG